MKKKDESLDAKYEVELTDELIKELVKKKKWGDERSLKEYAKIGAKWNLKRNSLIIGF